ncbi:jg15202, partial [Pararge aegeria aegeria]
MAVSCPEVMYGAYYPYLYGRGAARSFHHAPHFQYDRVSEGPEARLSGTDLYFSM